MGRPGVETRAVLLNIELWTLFVAQVAVPPGYAYEPLKPMSSTPVKVSEISHSNGCFQSTCKIAAVNLLPFTPFIPPQEYPFVLDPFQKEALRCIENSHSVLVSAHTSAGKTVVAEYAIAMSLRDTQRVIYTTPIKASGLLVPLVTKHN